MDIVSAALPAQVPNIGFHELDRAVTNNLPATLRQQASNLGIKAGPESIISEIAGELVNVALTPMGNADAPLDGLFVQPCQIPMTVKELMICLQEQNENRVFYMQSQDDNLNKELSRSKLIPRAPPVITESSKLLRNPPEASNLWIGSIRTCSRLHNDNYENIFVQVSGRKRFYLIPPSHVYGLHEQFLVPARYDLRGDGTLELCEDTELAYRVLFPTVDPSNPETFNDIYTDHCKVYTIDLEPGDALFIPCLWYHQVEIISHDLNLSVNYWYAPSEYNPLWAMWDHLRLTSLVSRGYYDKDYFQVPGMDDSSIEETEVVDELCITKGSSKKLR